ILSDRARLIRRTQLKRVNADRIAGPSEQTHDPEIFDDDDFYQTLLKEFIDQKSSQTLDPIQISR
uniref:TRAUB domain-containing protein n=2 Tax=Bursaphelenchus xylophilus TaxID=6326 RepID=A0A1I7SNV7_BURXY